MYRFVKNSYLRNFVISCSLVSMLFVGFFKPKPVKANPALAVPAIVANPAIVVPVLGVVAVAGGAYITKNAYDNYFKPWAMNKLSGLGVKAIKKYFQIKTNNNKTYVTTTKEGRTWINDNLKEFSNNNVSIPKVNTTANNVNTYYDSDGYLVYPLDYKNISASEYRVFDFVGDKIFVPAGEILSIRISFDTSPDKFRTYECGPYSSDKYVSVKRGSYTLMEYVYNSIRYFVTDVETGVVKEEDPLSSPFRYGSINYLGFKVGDGSVSVPTQSIIGDNKVIDYDKTISEELGVEITSQEGIDGTIVHTPSIPWEGNAIGQGVKTKTFDTVIDSNVSDDSADSIVSDIPIIGAISDLFEKLFTMLKELFIPNTAEIVNQWNDYVDNVKTSLKVPAQIAGMQLDGIKPPLIFTFTLFGVNLVIDLRFIDTPRFLDLIHMLTAGLSLFLLAWYNYKKVYSIIRGVSPSEGNMGTGGNSSGISVLSVGSSDVPRLGGK